MQIEMIGVNSLIPYAKNSRTHSNSQIDQISASIRQFGFTNPVLIDGNGEIIAGHGRVIAALKIGLEEIPVIRLAYLSEAQKRAYVIADNQIAANAGWDDAMLLSEITALRDENFDLMCLGFSDVDLNNILFVPPSGLTDPDCVPTNIVRGG